MARAVPRVTWSGPLADDRRLWLPQRIPLSILAILIAKLTGTPCRRAAEVTKEVASDADNGAGPGLGAATRDASSATLDRFGKLKK